MKWTLRYGIIALYTDYKNIIRNGTMQKKWTENSTSNY